MILPSFATRSLKFLGRSLPFLFGFGFAFMPSYGPFLGLLLFFNLRWHFKRLDIFWALATLLLTLPYFVQADMRSGLELAIQLSAGWLVYRTFMELRVHRFTRLVTKNHQATFRNQALSWGLLSGLLLVVLLGWLQIDALNWSTAKTIASAIVWERNPNFYGHSVFLIGSLIAIMMLNPWLRCASLGISALGVLVAGSREAALAWLIVALIILISRRGRVRDKWLEAMMITVMLFLTSSLGGMVGWGNVGFLLDIDLNYNKENQRNILQGTEIANGDWWDANGVAIEASTISIAEQNFTRYTLSKTAPRSWQRLQQIIPLEPNQVYTFSVWLHPHDDALSAVQGWGLQAENRAFTATGQLDAQQQWQGSVAGSGSLLSSGVLEKRTIAGEVWQHVYVSFRYEGAERLYFWLGMTPDARQGLQGVSSFAGFQLERAESVSAYQAGTTTRGLGLRVARLPLWQSAWQGFREMPWLGQGKHAFGSYHIRYQPQRQLNESPLHAHNLFLQTLFEQGLLGLLGLISLLAVLLWMAYRQSDGLMISVLIALLFINLFDTTLFYSGIFYPLLAVTGWRAGRSNHLNRAANQGIVQLCLVLADILTLCLALACALGVEYLRQHYWGAMSNLSQFNSTIFYSLLLLPLIFWRQGLYPGYGLSAAQELRSQVVGSVYAGLILITLSFLFPSQLPFGRILVLLLLFFVIILVPFTRLWMKNILLKKKLWGRNVIIIGAGALGQRVAKAMQNNPLNGLHPVAFFADDVAQGHSYEAIRVRGTIAEANDYAEKHHIEHVIIAKSSSQLYHDFSVPQPPFRIVQFVPELAMLPYQDVRPSHLDGLLALELRSGLYLAENRFIKRSVDIILSALATLVLLPLFLLIYLWIRLDSRGAGFYWSERIGEGGKPFRFLKFRSMYHNADSLLETLLQEDEALRAEYETYHKLEHDPRITRAGRFLRATDLDELAQLYNVLRGEMSLIGPRPYMVKEAKDMHSYQALITAAKPGMSGYWQVSGRNEIPFEERLQMEAHYVRNWSIWWDVVLTAQTIALLWRRWWQKKK